MEVFVRSALVLLFAVLSLSACTSKNDDSGIPAHKQADPDIAQTFSVPKAETLPVACSKASCIRIQKSSLGKIFLLLVSGKTAGSTPQWYDVKPMVVSFDRSGGQVAVLAENYNTIYNEIKTQNLVSSFTIVDEDEKSIIFDWGRGLDTLIVQTPYQIDAPRDDQPLTESSFQSFPIISSYVRNIKFDEKNIELEQISKLAVNKVKGEGEDISIEHREETFALNVQIRSYNLGSAFKVKEADKSRRVGFFVTKSAVPEKSTENRFLITKFDIDPAKGPILVRISAAVPADYLEAVKEGALYWNHVFGREVLKVVTGVDPQAGPEDRSIMLRWLPWMDAGAAYAMGQSDPLTGEVLRAQVFMPAVFKNVGSADLVSLNPGHSPVFGNGATACDFSENVKHLQKLASEAPSSQRLRLAKDSVRSTVAHELGHALGLRHNFAGSYTAKVSTDDIYKSASTYFKDLQHPGLETSTSIMDYVSGLDNILMAAKIKNSALSYDKMAMDWAYSEGDGALNVKISGYCSDEDIALAQGNAMAIYGCERFDAGANPLQRKYLTALENKQRFVNVLFTSIIGRLYPADKPGVVENLDKVLDDTQKWGVLEFTDEAKFIKGVVTDRTMNGTPFMTYVSNETLKAGGILIGRAGGDAHFNKVRAQHLKEAGGYAKMLTTLLQDGTGKIDLLWLQTQVNALVQSGVLAKGTTLGGREYILSAEDQKKILGFYVGLAEKNSRSLLREVIGLLPTLEQKVSYKDQIVTISLPIGKNLIDAKEAGDLSALVLQLMDSSVKNLEIKVGPELKKSVFVPAKVFAKEEVALYLPLLVTQGVGFNQDMSRALAKKHLLEGINYVLTEIDPATDFTALKPEEQAALVGVLKAQGLIDVPAQAWLTREIALYSAL